MTSGSLPVLAAVAVIVAVAVVFALVAIRRRSRGPEVHPLAAADATRYHRDFDAIQEQAAERPQPSAARARGLVEEVLRRMGFPDRVDSVQKARDVAAYDREVSKLLTQADTAIRAPGAGSAEMERVIALYSQALDRLLPAVEELEDG
jgi:hypothetical protein